MKVKIYSARHIKIESENDAEMVILEGLEDFKRATVAVRKVHEGLTDKATRAMTLLFLSGNGEDRD